MSVSSLSPALTESYFKQSFTNDKNCRFSVKALFAYLEVLVKYTSKGHGIKYAHSKAMEWCNGFDMQPCEMQEFNRILSDSWGNFFLVETTFCGGLKAKVCFNWDGSITVH